MSWVWSIEEDEDPDLQKITKNFRCLTNEEMNEIGQRSGDLAFGIERLQGGKEGGFQHAGMFSKLLRSCKEDFNLFRFLGPFAFSRKATVRFVRWSEFISSAHYERISVKFCIGDIFNIL